MASKEYSESKESSEQTKLSQKLSENEKQEEKEWRIKTDAAAFGRKRIEIPERW